MGATHLLELAATIGELDLFLAATEAAALDELLAGDEPLTVLAPTDAAFGDLSEAALAGLINRQPGDLGHLVRSHLVAGAFRVAEMTAAGVLRTMTGEDLPVDALDGVLAVDGAVVVRRDLLASNGVLHTIDRVRLSAPTRTRGAFGNC
jgi:uncharacterized surface protein with fasciclin (FAS1) repeats